MDKPGAEGIMTPKEARGPDDFPKPGRKDAIGRNTDHQGVEAAGERCFLDRLDQDAPAPGPDDILEKDEQDDQGKQKRIRRPEDKPQPGEIHLPERKIYEKSAAQKS